MMSGYCLNEVSLAACVEFTSDKTVVSAASLFAYFFGDEKKRLRAECGGFWAKMKIYFAQNRRHVYSEQSRQVGRPKGRKK